MTPRARRIYYQTEIIFMALVTVAVCILLVFGGLGCGGDARVDLAAADALDAVSAQMDVTLNEYHREVTTWDTSREAAVTAAFIMRIRRDSADESKCEQHASEFTATLTKIRTDRDVENLRAGRAGQQAAAVREIARGLRRIGIESLALQDEMKRYFASWVDTMKRANAAPASAGVTGVPRVPLEVPASAPAE